MKIFCRILLWLCIGLLAGVLLALICIPMFVTNSMTHIHAVHEDVWEPADFDLQAQPFTVFTEDSLCLSAHEVAVPQPQAVVVCLSGIHNPSASVFLGHARLFSQWSYATVYFDMRAHGQSDGKRIGLGVSEVMDVKAILKYIKAQERYRGVPVVVMGLSMGAAAAINATGALPEIAGLISLSAFASWEQVFCERMAEYVPAFIAKAEKPFVNFYLFCRFGRKAMQYKPYLSIRNLGGRPALLMHTRRDSQVPYADFEKLLSEAPPHVSVFTRDNDEHFVCSSFVHPEDDAQYCNCLHTFLSENFPAVAEK